MNPIERGRNLLNQVKTGAEKAVNKVETAVEKTVDKVHDVAVDAGHKIHNVVDGFETKAVSGAKAVQGFFGGGNQADRVYDGQFVGTGGKTFPPGTALKDIPGVTPKNNPNPSETIVYVNGINTTKDGQYGSLESIAETTGAKVVGIHNATEGMGADLAQCVKDKLDKGTNPAVDTLADTLYQEIKAGRSVHVMAHSQGGLITSRALGHVYDRLRLEDGMSKGDAQKAMSKLNVETFGAAAMHYPDGPNYVHYVNKSDLVPDAFGLGPTKWNPLTDGGQGSVTHRFNEFHLNPIESHNFESVYLQHRVPFDQARAGKFND
ncbi:putative lipase [Hyalangium versicolor]|uniref:putative lipase n=1 Tax=Hyalangium versicolor TaxID=2861190 RepID=UPI001CCFC5A3|nr:putative lipase [Hyalangium versicolor]